MTLGSYPGNDYAYTIRDELGVDNASIIEATNACSSPAVSLLHLEHLQDYFPHGAKTLITGAEIFTPFIDQKDLILFSDRAGALTFELGKDIRVLTPYKPGVTVREYPDANDAFKISQPYYKIEGMQTSGGVIYTHIDEKAGRINIISRTGYTDSQALKDTQTKDTQTLVSMNGITVAKWMARETPKLIIDTAKASNASLQEIKMIIPHQANGRLLEMFQKKLSRATSIPRDDLPPVYWCGKNIGNCVSQTTFYALMKALEGHYPSTEDKILDGDKLLVTAFGAGLASAAAVIEVNHLS